MLAGRPHETAEPYITPHVPYGESTAMLFCHCITQQI